MFKHVSNYLYWFLADLYYFFCFRNLMGITDCLKDPRLQNEEMKLADATELNEFHCSIGVTNPHQVLSPHMLMYFDAVQEYSTYWNDVVMVDGGDTDTAQNWKERMESCLREHTLPESRKYAYCCSIHM